MCLSNFEWVCANEGFLWSDLMRRFIDLFLAHSCGAGPRPRVCAFFGCEIKFTGTPNYGFTFFFFFFFWVLRCGQACESIFACGWCNITSASSSICNKIMISSNFEFSAWELPRLTSIACQWGGLSLKGEMNFAVWHFIAIEKHARRLLTSSHACTAKQLLMPGSPFWLSTSFTSAVMRCFGSHVSRRLGVRGVERNKWVGVGGKSFLVKRSSNGVFRLWMKKKKRFILFIWGGKIN